MPHSNSHLYTQHIFQWDKAANSSNKANSDYTKLAVQVVKNELYPFCKLITDSMGLKHRAPLTWLTLALKRSVSDVDMGIIAVMLLLIWKTDKIFNI